MAPLFLGVDGTIQVTRKAFDIIIKHKRKVVSLNLFQSLMKEGGYLFVKNRKYVRTIIESLRGVKPCLY